MDLNQQVPVWIRLPIDDERLDTYRAALLNRVGAPDVYQEIIAPHITIHPGFKTTPHGVEAIRTYLAGRDINPDVTATAIYAYPSIETPMVVALAVRADLAALRADIQYILNAYDHTIINEPAPTHVTLFTGRGDDSLADGWQGLPEDAHDRLRTAIHEMTLPSGRLGLGEPRVEWYNPPYALGD